MNALDNQRSQQQPLQETADARNSICHPVFSNTILPEREKRCSEALRSLLQDGAIAGDYVLHRSGPLILLEEILEPAIRLAPELRRRKHVTHKTHNPDLSIPAWASFRLSSQTSRQRLISHIAITVIGGNQPAAYANAEKMVALMFDAIDEASAKSAKG
jgi:hypothetical protein